MGMFMLVISQFFFLLLAFYLDAVLPRTYGDRSSVCFCFQICYCKSMRKANSKKIVNDSFETRYLKNDRFEEVPPEISRLELDDEYLKIQNLSKIYPNGFKALNDIDVKMYSG